MDLTDGIIDYQGEWAVALDAVAAVEIIEIVPSGPSSYAVVLILRDGGRLRTNNYHDGTARAYYAAVVEWMRSARVPRAATEP